MSTRMRLEKDLERVRVEQLALREQAKLAHKALRALSQKTTRRAETLIGQAVLKLVKSGEEVTPSGILKAVAKDAKATDADAIDAIRTKLNIKDVEPIASLPLNEREQNNTATDDHEGASVSREAVNEEAGHIAAETREPDLVLGDAEGVGQASLAASLVNTSRQNLLDLSSKGNFAVGIARTTRAEDVGKVDGA